MFTTLKHGLGARVWLVVLLHAKLRSTGGLLPESDVALDEDDSSLGTWYKRTKNSAYLCIMKGRPSDRFNVGPSCRSF